MDAYIEKFQTIVLFFPNVKDGKLSYLFMDGLQDPIISLVKDMEPSNLSMIIRKAKLLEGFS